MPTRHVKVTILPMQPHSLCKMLKYVLRPISQHFTPGTLMPELHFKGGMYTICMQIFVQKEGNKDQTLQ